MAFRGDTFETQATLLDGDDDPITGAVITFLVATGPGGIDLDEDRLSWVEDNEPGLYIVSYETTEDDPLGAYYVQFQFDDPDAQIFETEGGEWVLERAAHPGITVYTDVRTGSNRDVPPHPADGDGTHDTRYWLRDEDPTPASHVHGSLGSINYNDSASINFTVADPNVTAAAIFGSTAGTVAEGNHTHDDRYYTEAEIATLLATKAGTSHAHSGADITSGVVPIARLPTGSLGTQVALGNHGHTHYETVQFMYGDGVSVPAPGAPVAMWRTSRTKTLVHWGIHSLTAGSVALDLRKGTYSQWPLNSSNSISSGASIDFAIPPTFYQWASDDFTGWTTTTFADDDLCVVYLDAITTITQFLVVLKFTRTI